MMLDEQQPTNSLSDKEISEKDTPQTIQEQLSEYAEVPAGQEWPDSKAHTVTDGGSTHTSLEECAAEGTVVLEGDTVWQGGKVARLGTCHVCDRKFE